MSLQLALAGMERVVDLVLGVMVLEQELVMSSTRGEYRKHIPYRSNFFESQYVMVKMS